jgi:hypothetical protein
MTNNKKIEKRLENDLGFDDCKVNESQINHGDKFEAECKNSYEDSFSCQGKFSIEKGTLSKTNCEKKE